MTVVFNSTATLSALNLVAARSGLPSPLKSAAATEVCVLPAAKLVGAVKVPPVPPSSTKTRLSLKLVTARSGSPSRLKSATATAETPLSVVRMVGPVKRAAGAAEQHHDLAGGLVGDCEVGVAVVVEVAHRDRDGVGA